MKIKQGSLYLYKKSDSDWAVVMAGEEGSKRMLFAGTIIAASKTNSLVSFGLKERGIGKHSHSWLVKDFKPIPCQISFTCKPKKPKKGEKLTVEGDYFFG